MITCKYLIPTVKTPKSGGGGGGGLAASAIVNRIRRGCGLRAGAGPSTVSYAVAFFLPVSLLVVTVITSIRVADKLDQKYLEELAANLAIMESEDDGEREEEDDEELSRTRRSRRPKRTSDSSSDLSDGL